MKSILAATVLWVMALSSAMPGVIAQAPKKTDRHQNLSLFSHSDNCVACHNNLSNGAGEDVSIGAFWRSTMMANSSRDPYWQASVRRETIDHPMHSAAIQDECSACHMPMPQKIAAANGTTVDAFSHQRLTGHIESFSPAAGSEFAVIKPDNATGNFTKIAQRVGVRIAFDEGQPLTAALTPGLSVVVSVDKSSQPRLAAALGG